MKPNDQKLKDILLLENFITPENIQKAEEFAKTHHVGFLEYLLTEGIITFALLGQAIAESYKLPYHDFKTHKPTPEQVLKIPAGLARQYRIVLVAEDADTVTITTDTPEQTDALQTMQPFFPNKKINLAYSLEEDIDAALMAYFRIRSLSVVPTVGLEPTSLFEAADFKSAAYTSSATSATQDIMHDPAFVIQCRAMEAPETDPRDRYFDLIGEASVASETHAAVLSLLRDNRGPGWMIEHMEKMLIVPHLITQWREAVERIIGQGLVPTVTEAEAIAVMKIRFSKTGDTWERAVGHVLTNRDTPKSLIGHYFNEYVAPALVLHELEEAGEPDEMLRSALDEVYGSEPLRINTFEEKFGADMVQRYMTGQSRLLIEKINALAARINVLYAGQQLSIAELKQLLDEGSMLIRGEPMTFA